MKNNVIGKNIKLLRTEKGIMQKDLALAMEVSKQTMCAWEMGIYEPDLDVVVKLAKHFGITTDDLLGFDL